MSKPMYQGSKKRGTHTTYMNTSWMKRFIKKAHKEKLIDGINLGIIVKKTGKTKSQYTAKISNTGIQMYVFGTSQKQVVYLHTDDPEEAAEALGLKLKRTKT